MTFFGKVNFELDEKKHTNVDEMEEIPHHMIPLSTGSHTSQVVQDFSHQQ